MKKADSSWKLSDKDIKFVNRYEKKFFSGELERPLSVYEQKLKQIGCEGCDHVLDVGCGIGQWAIAGAKLNRKVTAFDMRQCRLDVGEKLKSVHKANIEFQLSSMEEFKSPEKFDFIFCYGAFMFLEMDKALEKFSSLLTENGKIYLNYNNLGWYFRMGFSMGLFKLKFNLFIAMFNFMLRSLTGASKNRIVDLSYRSDQRTVAKTLRCKVPLFYKNP